MHIWVLPEFTPLTQLVYEDVVQDSLRVRTCYEQGRHGYLWS